MHKIKSHSFATPAILLSLSMAPALSAGSLGIPLPTTCLNTTGPASCPDTQNNVALYQDSLAGAPYLGDIFAVPNTVTSPYTINSLTVWGTMGSLAALQADTLTLNYGGVTYDGSGNPSFSSTGIAGQPVITQDQYTAAVTQYQSIQDGTMSDIFRITFNNLNWSVSSGACANDLLSQGCYAWAIVAQIGGVDDPNFALLAGFDPNYNIAYPGGNLGALTFFGSDFSYQGTGYAGQITGAAIGSFGLAPSANFDTNAPEPAVLLCVGLGLVGLGFKRRKS